ncbi:hypothetical protein C7H19_19005 [Aphanothece hegewaldii CCALA 016]|uniref:Glutaredoxin domain-containing protein n=2 Tax=Aphanothece TaxID=1121 RepID=A0A2T1LTS9_9CHRO|nr:hypothetical protein C7H19_19005 [Aphanothece hegewaldii CCALA 016]
MGQVMKKSNLIIFFALLILPNSAALADCLNCWINPKTGKLESFGQSIQPQVSRSSTLLVYGTTNCPLTMSLLQELRQQKIPHQFKNIEQSSIAEEYYKLMQQTNLVSDTRIPKVMIQGRVLTRPSVAEITAIQSRK